MIQYTLFVNPLPNAVTLTAEVHRAWSRAKDAIVDAGNIEPSAKSIELVSVVSCHFATYTILH